MTKQATASPLGSLFFRGAVSAGFTGLQLLIQKVAVARGYWSEDSGVAWEDVTERERVQVDEQLRKLGDRIARILGYEESWIG